ncbi:hypothetical protein [Variovorax sp. CY25R-8]|uniref:hypothetical protein n=1 Tax=Variovorax sp. CY25R-8 TaxID=2855501 RepID=UPI0021BB136C|nr:hypothetical protein [Variovorax sp. CY25R-8]MCT8174387.1 hypothetical protein [Variovorax sp. CY25R-8]
MASVVDTSVKNFNNTMGGAPVVNGVAGSFIAMFDAVGVNGFDSKIATSLTIAGGVATLAFTGGHSAQVDSVIALSGITATYAALNGEQKVTSVAAGIVRFATNMADGSASGTVTFKMAPAGFEKVFAGPNKAVYRSLSPLSTKMLLRVDDTNAQFVRVVGYESMTDIDTGVGAFPTAAQISGGGYWPKSSVTGTAAVPWVLASDGRTFIYHVAPLYPQSTSYVHGMTRGFGDAIALKPGGDAFACFLSYSVQSSPGSMYDSALDAAQSGLYTSFPRSYSGLGSAQGHACIPYTGQNALSGLDGAMGPFPSRVDGTLRLSRRFLALATTNAEPRADLPGLLSVPQSGAFNAFRTGDRQPGADAFAGRTLIALNPTNTPGTPNDSNTGASFIDITGPWR